MSVSTALALCYTMNSMYGCKPLIDEALRLEAELAACKAQLAEKTAWQEAAVLMCAKRGCTRWESRLDNEGEWK